MLSNILSIAVLATMAAAQCGPSSSSSSSASSTSSAPPPPPTGIALNPNGNTGKCLDIAGSVLQDGTEVRVYDCNGSNAQKWQVNRGDGKVRVAAKPSLCLDAGINPANGSKLKIWTCYDGLKQQQWFWTGDNRLALTNQGLCMDLTNGVLGGAGVASPQTQVWECATGNTNQVWTSPGVKRRAVRYSDKLE